MHIHNTLTDTKKTVMKKILVIEDETGLREEIGEMLSFEGYEVILADNGLKGLFMTLNKRPDLILCDIMMPEMTGNQLLTTLRSDKNTKTIQFVFMTALADKENIRSGMNLGADDYLTKPFSRDELLKTVSAQLQKADSHKTMLEQNMDHLRDSIITKIPHEFRTPLNGMLALGSFLSENSENIDKDEIREIGNMIYKSAETLQSTINKYLIYITLKAASNSELCIKKIQVSSETISGLAIKSAEKYNRSADLKINIEQTEPFLIYKEFLIILEELTDNAFKFSFQGTGVTLTISIKNNSVILSLHNSGRVFPEGSSDKIGAFIQFERDKYEQQGSGLGLIITKKLVEHMNGSLNIKSTPDEGTKVTVSVPLS